MKLFLGNKVKKKDKKKIIYCGILRYEDWWVKKFIKNSIKKQKKFIILVALRPPHNFFFSTRIF